MPSSKKTREKHKASSQLASNEGEGEDDGGAHKGNKLDGGIRAKSDSLLALKETASDMFAVVKGHLGNFVQSSDGLLRTLEEIGQVHPFVMIALVPFRAALALELKRRENNKKVLALIVQMCDMMAALRLLASIKPAELGSGAESLADQMGNRLKEAASAIEECSHVTDEYYKMKMISRLIRCVQWEEKFADFATTFANFSLKLTGDLAIYTGAGVQAIHRVVGNIDEKMTTFMKLIFASFVSPDEYELSSFIDSRGGPDSFIKDEKLLMDLFQKREAQQATTGQKYDYAFQGRAGFELGNSAFNDTKKELLEDLDDVLAGSKDFFFQKFEEQKNQIAEVKDVIRRESDRIVGQLLSGAHDRVLDKHLHTIWVEMGWKGSTKALNLVLALRDFYVNHHQYVLSLEKPRSNNVEPAETSSSSSPQSKDPGAKDVKQIEPPTLLDIASINPDDTWAISFLSKSHLRSLMEAVDPDWSGYVTIKEINDFTSSRPKDWSLPQWIAYWTVGFEVTVRQYCHRIRDRLSELYSLHDSIAPGNVGVFSSVASFRIVESIISRVHAMEADDVQDEYQNQCFQEYASGIENQLDTRLKRFNYLIDDMNTLSLVTGPGRIEEHVFPLLYLLLGNCIRIAKKGQTQRLQYLDFNGTIYSFYTLWDVVWERVTSLQRVFKLRNLSVTDEFRRYSHGMYYYMISYEELDKDRGYFNLPQSGIRRLLMSSKDTVEDMTEDSNISDPNALPSSGETDPNYSLESLDFTYQKDINPDVSEMPGLIGTWSGFYYYGFSTSSDIDGLMSFHINSFDENGTFSGGGADSLAQFTIDGNLDGSILTFSKLYTQLFDGIRVEWAYSGEVNEGLDTIVGKWGSLNVAPSGMFTVQKKSPEYLQFYPSTETGIKPGPRALWKFAIDVTLHRLSARTIRWSVLKKRRDQRRRFIELFKKYQAFGLRDTAEAAELKALQSTLPISDVTFYRKLAELEQDREVVHRYSCNSCLSPLRMTRLMCLDCSTGHYIDTVDICSSCINKAFTVTRAKGTEKLEHVTTHTLLQIRRPTSVILQHTMRENANFTSLNVQSQELGDGSVPRCKVCGDTVEKPYWVCCECPNMNICVSCNRKTEQWRPWLYERKNRSNIGGGKHLSIPGKGANELRQSLAVARENGMYKDVDSSDSDSDSTDGRYSLQNDIDHLDSTEDLHIPATIEHHWSHNLVLCTSPKAVSMPVSLEGRVIGLEDKIYQLQEQGKAIEEGMSRLEARLESLEKLLRSAFAASE